nr:transcription factor spt8 [Quercus suber]
MGPRAGGIHGPVMLICSRPASRREVASHDARGWIAHQPFHVHSVTQNVDCCGRKLYRVQDKTCESQDMIRCEVPDSPSQRFGQHTDARDPPRNPAVVLTSPSPRTDSIRSPGRAGSASFVPSIRPEALSALTYDIVPTMAAPQSTSINAVAATPDMKWVFSGGTDGYVRMYNWVETANGKVPLTVAQKHPFVDSVMKAGSLVTYWENEEPQLRTPPQNSDEGKWTSPVYSLAVQHQAVWLLSGLESGGINMQTCRHQAGTRITTMKEHTSAVSVLVLSQDETNLLSGSWDKNIHDWDLQTGQVKRTFKGSGGQISAIETRPISDLPVPEVSELFSDPIDDTFYSNNADKPLTNGFIPDDMNQVLGGAEEDALGSPSGSLFGENDHGSLFGEDNVAGGSNAFGDDDDELSRALQSGLDDNDRDAPGEQDTDMGGVGVGGPVQPPDSSAAVDEIFGPAEEPSQPQPTEDHSGASNGDAIAIFSNGLPHSDEPLTAPPTNEDEKPVTDLPPQSESTFLDSAIDGTLRIWDRRMSTAIATIQPNGSTPPWCTGACWSPGGNFFYAGRRNNTVDEYSIHHLGSKRSEPNRVFKFQPGSGPVYAVRAMPNRKHLVCASQDILRIYDTSLSLEHTRHRPPPFQIVPGHRGGFISTIFLDPACRFMISAAGNRGWEGGGTEVLLGYEIACPQLDRVSLSDKDEQQYPEGRSSEKTGQRCSFALYPSEVFPRRLMEKMPRSWSGACDETTIREPKLQGREVACMRDGVADLASVVGLLAESTDSRDHPCEDRPTERLSQYPPLQTIHIGSASAQILTAAHLIGIAQVNAIVDKHANMTESTALTDPVAAMQAGLAKMLSTGEFSDFEIRCGPDSYKEGEENMIELKSIGDDPQDDVDCDDPEAIKLMIDFFYHLDYTGPETEYMFQRRAEPVTKGYRQTYNSEPPPPEPRRSDCSTTLHAKVFAAAVKYQIPALQALASTKFSTAAEQAWDNDEFCTAAHVVYTTTPDSRKELRNVVADTIMAHRALLDKPDMQAVTFSIDGLAYELLQKCLEKAAGESSPNSRYYCDYCRRG